MANSRSVLVACALVVALVTPAWAQRQRLFDRPPSRSQVVQTGAPRKVEVVRRTRPTASHTTTSGEEIDAPGVAPLPDDQLQLDEPSSDWSPAPAAGGCSSGGCAAGGCEGGSCGLEGRDGGSCEFVGCQQCGLYDCCCTPFWAHRSYVFGEFLYLSPFDADMAYAMQQNGAGGQGTVPDGRVGVVDPGFNPAFRAGFAKRITDCASLGASYSNYHSHSFDEVTAPPGVGGTVASLVLHPNSTNAGSTSSLIFADYDVDFQLIDVDYRRILHGGERSAVNALVGIRYGKLQQDFQSIGEFAQPNGRIVTDSTIRFEGVGLRAGLDGERRLGCTRLSAYGNTWLSMLFGTFNTQYTQFDTTTDILQAQSSWRDQRVVPVLEYEVGISWTSRGGHLRFSTGYYTAFWFNSVTTPEYVRAVQRANFVGLGDTVSFTGLVSRAEYRF